MTDSVIRTAAKVAQDRTALVRYVARSSQMDTTSQVRQVLELVLIEFAMRLGAQDDDQFTDALVEAILTPIKDRANASAQVPLAVPDEPQDAP